ncbi:hypothetical protein LJB92_04450 [Bacteroidales bacterium OttesenSCG-928-M06]|nr:hypothetical protein [Bacteroidales bacterium OttesenSCG-928-M06]
MWVPGEQVELCATSERIVNKNKKAIEVRPNGFFVFIAYAKKGKIKLQLTFVKKTISHIREILKAKSLSSNSIGLRPM